MPSYAKLYAATKIVKDLRFLELVNASDAAAGRITLQLTHQGEDVSVYLAGDVPRRLAGRERSLVLLSTAPGPLDVEVSLQWEDDAGIPGVWHGVARRY